MVRRGDDWQLFCVASWLFRGSSQSSGLDKRVRQDREKSSTSQVDEGAFLEIELPTISFKYNERF